MSAFAITLIILSGSLQSFASTSAPYSSSNWMTYHKGLNRDGYLNSSSSHPVAFDWKSSALDGLIYAEPLVFKGVVYIATENNSVYALSDTNGVILWKAHLGTPVPGDSLPCGDIDPSGITGTPAIDPTSGLIYVVAYLYPPQHHVLFALSTKTGQVMFKRNVDVKGLRDTLTEQQRGALAVANGVVYTPYGGLDGDCGIYHGYIVGVPENGSSTIQYKVPTTNEGGIWSASGPSVDSSGNVFVTTGNSASTTKFDFGEAVIELSPNLKEVSYFAPSNWAYLNGHDIDLGSVGPAILGGSGLVFQIGKEGVGYLLNQSHLGGIGGQLFSKSACPGSSKAFGGIAYANHIVYAACVGGLVALNVSFVSSPTFSILWDGPSFWAGPPIVSDNAVWTVDINNGILYALNPMNGTIIFSYSIGSVVHFISPASADGRVFVGAGYAVYGFKI